MRLSILWRSMEIEDGVVRRGRRPRRITPSEISIILHMIRKPNSITVLLFIQNNSQFKNIAKTCLPPSMHRCSVQLRYCTFRFVQLHNILQIADIALRVVFLLFLPCFWLFFRLVLTLETSEMSAIFQVHNQNNSPRPRVFLVNGALTCTNAAFLTSFPR